jgi:sulfate adenylyltransferase subunit 1 (EFTu-like GTPase family)
VAKTCCKTNVNTSQQETADRLEFHEFGRVEIETMRPLAVDRYRSNRQVSK